LQYIDTAGFWKDQFSRLHLEKKALEDEIRYLKEAHGLSKKRSRDFFEQDASLVSRERSVTLEGSQSQLEDFEIAVVNDDFLRVSSFG
jgi:hypothetical protein